MPDLTALAQAAYAAYGTATGGLTHDGRPMPDWDQLGDRIQHAWASAVQAILDAAEPSAEQTNPNAQHGHTDGCPHCPDGHQPSGSSTWNAHVAADRDSDGQPTHITVARPAGAHVSEADAEWVYRRLNGPTRR